MSTVDGVVTAPDAHGVVQGNGGAIDRMAGGSGNDRLEGHAEFNQYYGGVGSDTFIFSAQFGQHSDDATTVFSELDAYVTDFQGAGGYAMPNNDFIAFVGFGDGSSLTLLKEGISGTAGAKLYYYTITDGETGAHYNFMINSLTGKELGAGDYAFY